MVEACYCEIQRRQSRRATSSIIHNENCHMKNVLNRFAKKSYANASFKILAFYVSFNVCLVFCENSNFKPSGIILLETWGHKDKKDYDITFKFSPLKWLEESYGVLEYRSWQWRQHSISCWFCLCYLFQST